MRSLHEPLVHHGQILYRVAADAWVEGEPFSCLLRPRPPDEGYDTQGVVATLLAPAHVVLRANDDVIVHDTRWTIAREPVQIERHGKTILQEAKVLRAARRPAMVYAIT